MACGVVSVAPSAPPAMPGVFHFAHFRCKKGVEIIFVRPKLTPKQPDVLFLTGQMSSAETGQMSAFETGQMSAAETGQMSSTNRDLLAVDRDLSFPDRDLSAPNRDLPWLNMSEVSTVPMFKS